MPTYINIQNQTATQQSSTSLIPNAHLVIPNQFSSSFTANWTPPPELQPIPPLTSEGISIFLPYPTFAPIQHRINPSSNSFIFCITTRTRSSQTISFGYCNPNHFATFDLTSNSMRHFHKLQFSSLQNLFTLPQPSCVFIKISYNSNNNTFTIAPSYMHSSNTYSFLNQPIELPFGDFQFIASKYVWRTFLNKQVLIINVVAKSNSGSTINTKTQFFYAFKSSALLDWRTTPSVPFIAVEGSTSIPANGSWIQSYYFGYPT